MASKNESVEVDVSAFECSLVLRVPCKVPMHRSRSGAVMLARDGENSPVYVAMARNVWSSLTSQGGGVHCLDGMYLGWVGL